MSSTPGSRSTPSSFSESAAEYQVAGLPPVTSRHTSVAPAEPSVAPVAVQVSGSNVARMLTGTVLVSVEPQMLAAYWNAMRRCWPSVVPGLPPTGATGVGSLNPTPAALPLTMTSVAAACTAGAAANAPSVAAARAMSRSFILLFFMAVHLGGIDELRERRLFVGLALDAGLLERAIRVDAHDRVRHGRFVQRHATRIAG